MSLKDAFTELKCHQLTWGFLGKEEGSFILCPRRGKETTKNFNNVSEPRFPCFGTSPAVDMAKSLHFTPAAVKTPPLPNLLLFSGLRMAKEED